MRARRGSLDADDKALPMHLPDRLTRAIQPLRTLAGRREAGLLLGLALAAAGMLAFISIADEVFEGETAHFDRVLMLALRDPADLARPVGPRWLLESARDVTALGSMTVLTFVTLGVAGFLALSRRRAAALLVLASVGGGTLLSHVLKQLFDRPRPDIVPHAMEVYTQSFPSGHSMLSAVTWLTLGALLARVEPRRRVKTYVLGMAILTTLAVGASRVYLGVHWPTDVLGGWSLGASWALLCWLFASWLQGRGQVEPDMPRPGD
jgi:undecaprenyl-diphosphatase